MGCCVSLCSRPEIPDVDGRFPVIEILEKSDESSDSSLKAKGETGKGGRDITPLLEGPTLLEFHNLNLSGSSSSVDLEMDQIGKLLKPTAETPRDRESDAEDNQTFKDVHVDLNELSSSSEGPGKQ